VEKAIAVTIFKQLKQTNIKHKMKTTFRFFLLQTLLCVFFFSCKKEESTTPAPAFNYSTLYGTWGTSKAQYLNVSDNKLVYEQFAKDAIVITLKTDLTYTSIGKDTVPLTGTYSVQNSNNKLYLITIGKNDYGKTCIEEISDTSFVLNFKEDAVSQGESIYQKLTFRKK
jgi:hypothetical protein